MRKIKEALRQSVNADRRRAIVSFLLVSKCETRPNKMSRRFGKDSGWQELIPYQSVRRFTPSRTEAGSWRLPSSPGQQVGWHHSSSESCPSWSTSSWLDCSARTTVGSSSIVRVNFGLCPWRCQKSVVHRGTVALPGRRAGSFPHQRTAVPPG